MIVKNANYQTTLTAAVFEDCLQQLTAAVQARDLDAVLECFGDHPVLMLRELGTPVEGRGALRSYLRRNLPITVFGRPMRIASVDIRGADRALVRARYAVADEVRDLDLAMALERGRIVITHCHWR